MPSVILLPSFSDITDSPDPLVFASVTQVRDERSVRLGNCRARDRMVHVMPDSPGARSRNAVRDGNQWPDRRGRHRSARTILRPSEGTIRIHSWPTGYLPTVHNG